MTNFDYLQEEPKFKSFVDVAITAEKIIHIDPETCIINCRRAMEFAIKWMYSVDNALVMPYQDNLGSLMHTDEFKILIEYKLWTRLNFIRRLGNNTAHSGIKYTFEQASLCLQNLFLFFDYISFHYAGKYEERHFDISLFETEKQTKIEQVAPVISEIDLQKLISENKALKDELTKRRESHGRRYVVKPQDLSEYKTRKIYIDSLLVDVGWTEGKDWLNEVKLEGMLNKSEIGFADYILYDDALKPLAVIEAKKTCVDVSKGRQQAKLYADLIEKQFGRRPVIFLTNGFETRIIDGKYPERQCSAIYSKRDLEKWFNLITMRTSLKNVVIDKDIAGRYYQEAAIKAVCDSFDNKNRRKALLVMATGSGKTRTIIELCHVMQNANWIKNVLFLADRNSLVIQAKRNFVNLLPDLSCTNLCEEKDNYNARCVFSTYQTMMNLIDTAKDDEGKIFSCGHFDLIICDEAHRSIYNKYKDIFTYFDSALVGLTATPKDEIDKNTYSIFELESGVPTYGYELAQAVKDKYLVDFMSIETTLKFIEEGIVYDDLSAEDKEIYENTFKDEDGNIPESINSSALNTWVFNEDTIRKVLQILMTNGLKVDYGEKIGKTIIFAKNHGHAEKIYEIFCREYSYLKDYAKVIDNYINYSQSAIDEFSNPKKLPQIAISVDMLDTGIDIPEVLNLVFFKKVMSKAKFWQMIGRGTRLCPNLIDGDDKEKFYIFDFCGNFNFFRMSEGNQVPNVTTLQEAIFNLEFQLVFKLQGLPFQTDSLIAYRKNLVSILVSKVNELDRENFANRQHIKYIDLYNNEKNYNSLTYEDTLTVAAELAPLVLPDTDAPSAVRFDALIYGIELAYLIGKKHTRANSDLIRRINAISTVATIPEVQQKSELIQKILHTNYVEEAGINEFENIRNELRDLMKYIPQTKTNKYVVDIEENIASLELHDSDIEENYLTNYKAKAEFYIRQHQDTEVIAKLKTNKPLSSDDVKALQKILWEDIGTKEEYKKEVGEKPLGEFVREIVGMDMNAAKEAFAEYLNEAKLNSRQIYFVNQIVEYIVHNGLLKDFSVLRESPFTDKGSVVEIFSDASIWKGIQNVIFQINKNAAA